MTFSCMSGKLPQPPEITVIVKLQLLTRMINILLTIFTYLADYLTRLQNARPMD